jgi:hypothetical protein
MRSLHLQITVVASRKRAVHSRSLVFINNNNYR